MMVVSLNIITTGVICGAGTCVHPRLLVVFVLLDHQFSVYCFVDYCLSFFFWSLYCLSFLELWPLITPFAIFEFFLTGHASYCSILNFMCNVL